MGETADSPPDSPRRPARAGGGGPRERLLARAIDYYATHGVRDTSLRTLAAAIGTSQRMLHYHFGSREDLLAAVIGAVAEADAARLRALFEAHSDPFEAGRANWRAVANGARRLGPLFFELSSHAMYGRPEARVLTEVLVGRVEAAFEDAYRALVDPASARRLARLTVAVGNGLTYATLVDGDRDDSDAAVEEFVEMVRRYAEAAKPPRGDDDATPGP